jgi:hypothetical protein
MDPAFFSNESVAWDDGDQPMGQLMSSPQHMGDLILPWPLGHFEICTFVPSSNVKLSSTSGASHLAQVALTAIPHFAHSYVAI